MTREQRLAITFVELADSLVDDFDVVDLMVRLCERCVELLDTAAAGLLLADVHGNLRVMAATDEAAEAVEVFQVQSDEGPCRDSFHTGGPVGAPDLHAETHRWPLFAPVAIRAGFRAAHSLPMRLRGQIPLGALGLFRSEPAALTGPEIETAQALADVATIALLQNRALRDAHLVADQLQEALQSRIAVEQAKGIIAAHLGCDMNAAFNHLRGFARGSQRRLSAVAEDIVGGTMRPEELAGPPS